MKTFEVDATVGPDHTFVVNLPSDIAEGRHRFKIIVETPGTINSFSSVRGMGRKYANPKIRTQESEFIEHALSEKHGNH